ncbi:hypothetical protein ACFOWE_18195 [Planomonospora corallina]|uniref:Uncharacterized protein n=1 Tax=Planomonospora corallina TaxID=1806052 RepID=A0ABV8I7R9_9ACTN
MEAHGLRLESSRVVHLAGSAIDHRGEKLPAPACRVGVSGWDPRRLHVSYAPITCCRCVRLVKAQQLTEPAEQNALF